MTLEHDLGRRRNRQVAADAARGLGPPAAQQAGELVLGQVVRHRRDRAQDGGRVGTERHGQRERLAGAGQPVFAEVQRAAAVRQPAHDQLVAADHLLAVDAEVLALLVRPAGDNQAPGDQRTGIAGPAGLDRQARQIHRAAFPGHLLAGRTPDFTRRHVPQRTLEHGNLAQRIAQPLGRFRLLERSQQLPDFAQGSDTVRSHAQCHAARRAEQIAEYRNVMAGWAAEEQRRPAGAQDAVADLGHFQLGRHRHFDPPQFAGALQLPQEVPQIRILHRFLLLRIRRNGIGLDQTKQAE